MTGDTDADESGSAEDSPEAPIEGVGLDMSETSLEPCAACQEPIQPDAEVCPECGNHPAKTAKWSSVGLMVAGLFLLLVVPPLGIILFGLGAVARAGMIITDYPAVEYDF